MTTTVQQHIANITCIPLQALSYILLKTKFEWCPVGWTTWAMRKTPADVPFMKLQANAVPKSQREADYWPTLMAGGSQIVAPRRGKGQMITLTQMMALYEPDHIGEELNPAWGEVAMGFPEGWTDVSNHSDLTSQVLLG